MENFAHFHFILYHSNQSAILNEAQLKRLREDKKNCCCKIMWVWVENLSALFIP